MTDSKGVFRSRYRTLDHWRGVAALLVVVFHTTAQYRVVTKGSGLPVAVAGLLWLGVQLFFVISGYCIAAAVEGSFRRSDHPVSGYLMRRVRRIFPPYLAWLVALCAGVGVVESYAPHLLGRDSYRLSSLTTANWFGNISLTETWFPRVLGQPSLVFTRVGWTLCYEMQFYIVCMFLMFLPQKWFYRGVFVTSVVLGLVFLFERPMGFRLTLVGTFMDGRWLQFAMGIWVFHALTKGSRQSMCVCLVCLVVVTITAFACLGDYRFGEAIDLRTKRVLELGVCATFSVLLLAARRCDDGIADISWLEPLRRVGLSSYSLYLVHWPICKILAIGAWKLGLRSFSATIFVTTPVCLAVSVWAGFVFFRFFEKPFIAPPSTPLSAVASSHDVPVEPVSDALSVGGARPKEPGER